MRGKNTIIINGQAYDAVTGRPIIKATPMNNIDKKAVSDFGFSASKPESSTKQQMKLPRTERVTQTAHGMHRKPQRSQTLLRKATKRPESNIKSTQTLSGRSPMISRFAPHPVVLESKKPTIANTTSTSSPSKMAASIPEPSVPIPPTPAENSRQFKNHLIQQKMNESTEPRRARKKSLRNIFKSKPRTVHVASMCLALAMLGGYLTFINMPNLSVQVASARSGVQASYPEYQPNGYRFAGPIAYAPGEVTLRFKSNSSNLGYTVQQRLSSWDSQAVLDNFVTKDSDSYLTYSEQGLTIYTYKNKAAWVNGGVLYTIDGDAPLSSEQILRIAASL